MVIAGVLAVVLLVAIMVFQLALTAGAPLGSRAWGGRHPGVLPTRLRVASAIAGLVLYPLLGLVVLDSSDVIDVGWLPTGPGMMWALTAFFALGAVANLVSPSRPERIWAPVAGTVAVCCSVIALST